MSASILTTKLYFPPPRRNLVRRPRLIERLAVGLQGPLTLISAPPGSGKTTLMSEWRAGVGRDAPVAWLSLDASDNDPVRFLDCLVAALGAVRQGLVEGTAVLLQPGQPAPVEAVLASLINDLSAGCGDLPGGVVLILDDYHVITTPAIHDALAFLLAHLPPLFHLVILAREDPPLPLARLRVRGELTEIREGDLRFTVEEAAAFLTHTMGLDLSDAGIASLAERTEGWIAALQIAGLSLQNRGEAEEFIAAFRGDDHYVMDYLMDEVFQCQPAQIQDFLLQTSILQRLCASLCDQVTGFSESRDQRISESGVPSADIVPAGYSPFADSQSVLEHLERGNLFMVSLDTRREWYRFHNLFADLLRYRLQRTYPKLLPELHRRACHWYAEAGDASEAMQHALAIPDPALAADLAEQYMLYMIGSSQIATYLGWAQEIPDEIILQHAYLCVGCGWAYALTNQAKTAQRYADAGEVALPAYKPVFSTPEGRHISREEVAGNLLAIHSYVDRLQNDLGGAVAHAQEALTVLPPEALAVRCAVALNLGMLHLDGGELEPARQAFQDAYDAAERSRTNVYVAVTALSQLGAIAAMRGKLREAEGFFQRATRVGSQEAGIAARVPSIGVIHGWLVWLHYQRNEIAAAQEHLDLVLQSVDRMGVPASSARAFLYQALLAQCRGEMDRAEKAFGRAGELMRGSPGQGVIQAEWLVFRGQFYMRQGDLAAAARLLETQGVTADDLEEALTPSSERFRTLAPRLAAYVLLARVLAVQGAGQLADALLNRICVVAEVSPNVEVLLQALALRAVVAGSLQADIAHGLPHLQRALNLAAPEGFGRPILDAGGLLSRLLRQAIIQGIQPAFAQKLLAELAEEERRRAVGLATADTAPRKASPLNALIEPPTDRERQVLRLLAAGLSSTEIAEELVISVSTARSYIKSLYGKLDAHSREEAIERGKEVGLI